MEGKFWALFFGWRGSFFSFFFITLPETNISPEIGLPKRKVVFQPSIFRGYVSFREGSGMSYGPHN